MTTKQTDFEKRNQMEELVSAVRAHAITHYNTGGWDVLVECWNDAEIIEEIAGARTVKGAINNCAKTLRVIKDYGDDIRATAF